MLFFYFIGALFLGWSLGANDAANVFGSAVGSRMISFRKAAIYCSIFLILGAVFQGEGASNTINSFTNINKLSDAFFITFSSALTVFFMSWWGLPVSTSQAIIGSIIAFNIYNNFSIDVSTLNKIVISWISSPLLSAIIAYLLFKLINNLISKVKIHLLYIDTTVRNLLLLVGIFGSFSLGANNIANVVGVFINTFNINDIFVGNIRISSNQQLFFIGALSVSLGVLTFSKRTMQTVGNSLLKLNAENAFIVVFSHSLVLFLFSSEHISKILIELGLPSIPLVPVSSSQAIIGGILGIGLAKNFRGFNVKLFFEIILGWILTPITSGVFFYLLYFIAMNA